MTPIPKHVQNLVRSRARDCHGCGLSASPLTLHQRTPNNPMPANILNLCDTCHTIAHAGYRGYALGWVIGPQHDPEMVPTHRTSDHTWWRLDNDGGVEAVHPIDALEYMTLLGLVRVGFRERTVT